MKRTSSRHSMMPDASDIKTEQLASQKVALHPTASSHRFHLLDALRGIAALLIVLYHLTEFLPHGGFPNTYLAVDFFFCLSGFVIAFSYEKRLAEALTLKNFFAARMIRLYPTYLLGAFLGLVVLLTNLPYRLDGKDGFRLMVMIGLQFAMLPNPHILGNHFLFPLEIPAWSLFYELVANFAFASLVRMKLASGWVLAMLALVSYVLLTFWVRRDGNLDVGWDNSWNHVYLGIARVTLSFSVGVLVFRLFRRTEPYRPTQALQWILASAIPLALIFILLSSFTGQGGIVFSLLRIAVLFPTLVYLGSLSATPASWKGVCVFLGNISYPIYLLQGIFLAALYKPLVWKFAMQHPTLSIACLMLLLTGTAHLAVRFYDAPLRKRLTRYYNSRGLTITGTPRA
jgi:peptidoglycan/LPS O-acetylase OafA/YrhL